MALVLKRPQLYPCSWVFEEDDDWFDTDLLMPWFGKRRRNCHRRCPQKPQEWEKNVKLVGFSPENIDVKAEGGDVFIHATHEELDGDDVDRRECERKIKVPDTVDIDKLRTSYSSDGTLTLHAPFKTEVRDDTELAPKKNELVDIFSGAKFEEEDDYKVLKLDFTSFPAEDITVTVRDKVLHIHAKQETENGFKETFRRIMLPPNIDTEKVTSKVTSDGILKISAPKTKGATSSKTAAVEITESGKKRGEDSEPTETSH